MNRTPVSLSYLLLVSLLLTLFTVACGRKADGTPYGVDPARLPEARQKAAGAKMYKKDMPKGAEMNAVTNGARAGQPASMTPQPQTTPR